MNSSGYGLMQRMKMGSEKTREDVGSSARSAVMMGDHGPEG